MRNKNVFGIASLAIVGLLMVSMVSAYYVTSFNEENGELYESIDEAISNNDYDAWKELMTSTLTKENFDKQVEFRKNTEQRHVLMEELREAWEAGNSDRIAELRKELQKSSDGNFALRFGSSGETISGSKVIISGDKVVSEGQGKRLFVMNGEELEEGDMPKRIGIVADGEADMPKRVIKSSDSIQKRSFWDAFRFW